MEAIPYGRALYLVKCHSETFTIDLLRYHGNGQCDCWPFKKHIQPRIERAIAEGTFVPGPATKCPHIVQSDAALLDLFKQQLLKQFPDNEQPT